MPEIGATPFAQLNEGHLNALVIAGAEESRTLDVKREMYDASQGAKREFLKDVSAFANTAGGDLLIGIDETNGVITGVPGLTGNPDALILRLEQLVTNSVRPRIVGIEMRSIPLASGNFVIVVRVPRSWLGPHRVEAEDYRFYYRVSRGVERFDVDQLREAFLAGPEFAQRAREYRLDRVGKIAANAGAMPLADKSALVIHVLPRDVFSGTRVDGLRLRDEAMHLLPPGATSIRDIRFNLEGIFGYTSGGDGQPAASYAHLSRTGAYEAVRSNIVVPRTHPQAPDHLNSSSIERQIFEGARNGLNAMRNLDREGPYTLFVTLVGVDKAFYRPLNTGMDEAEVRGFDRDIVLASEEVFSELPRNGELGPRLHGLMDEIANAAGWTASPNRSR